MVDSKVSMPTNLNKNPHLQNQIQRLKKKEEEEHWISEEELHTEGSSDEEKSSHSSKRKLKTSHDKKGRSPSPAPKLVNQEHELKGTDNAEIPPTIYPEEDISWRPKRGSIKLPEIEVTDFSQSSEVV